MFKITFIYFFFGSITFDFNNKGGASSSSGGGGGFQENILNESPN